MTLSITQLAQLRAKGIWVRIEYGNGSTPQGERIYTSKDLVQLAKPGLFDRFTAFMGVRHA
jgi:hypothetical protein